MVKRIYGTAGNISISFDRDESTGLWIATVPAERDGEYVISLYAEDEAGNVAYMATILYTIQNLCVHMQVLNYAAEFQSVITEMIPAMDRTEIISNITHYKLDAAMTRIHLEVLKCEICGRWLP